MRAGLVAQKYAPEFLIGFGVTGMVGATVLACKATLKASAYKERYLSAKDSINIVYEHKDELIDEEGLSLYTEADYIKDKRLAKAQYVINVAQLYGPAVALGILSLTAIVSSHHILSQRNAALIAAYKLLDEGFKLYRKRVVESIDDEADRYFRYGGEERKYILSPETKKKKKKDKELDLSPEEEPPFELEGSIYAKYFDESSPYFKRDNDMNGYFLRTQQTWANQLLDGQGHVFLNEVYDMLGIPRTKAGAVVGWVKGYGDDYIDFGLMNPDNNLHRDFVNGYSPYILLDFNVDGVIFDII